MKRTLHTVIIAAATALGSCIVEFVPDIDADHSRLLVVEGNIIDGETLISLSWSQNLTTSGTAPELNPATGVRLRVESEAGGSFESVEILEYVELYNDWGYILSADSVGTGRYRIRVGALDDNTRYRLHIAAKGEEYVSGWRRPVPTPPVEEIDFNVNGEQVQVRVDLTGEKGDSPHYLWNYEETWEIRAKIAATHYIGASEGDYGKYNVYDWRYSKLQYEIFTYPGYLSQFYFCWKYNNSNELLLGSTELLAENALRDHVLFEFPVSDDRLSLLYHVKVYQQAVRGDAYQYLSNMEKNTDETGSIFAPIPSEMKGNLECVTNPDIPVIGFVEVSHRVEHEIYLDTFDSPYVAPRDNCRQIDENGLEDVHRQIGDFGMMSYTVVNYDPARGGTYSTLDCVDCRAKGGTKVRPSWWPNEHY